MVSELCQLAHKRAVPGIRQDLNLGGQRVRDGHVQITVVIDVRKSDDGAVLAICSAPPIGISSARKVLVIGCVVKRVALRGPLDIGVVCCDLRECGNRAGLIQVDLVLVDGDKHIKSTLDLHHGGRKGASTSSAERAARVDPERPIAIIQQKLVAAIVGNDQVQIACVWKRRRNAWGGCRG